MDKLMYSFENADDTLYVYQDRIVIKRRSTLVNALSSKRGEKTIFYNDITSVYFKRYSFISGGYIQFSVKGDRPNDNVMQIGGTSNNPIAEKVYNYVNSKIKETRSNRNTGNNASSVSNADEIRKYKKLLDDGIITHREFEAKKKQLLGL